MSDNIKTLAEQYAQVRAKREEADAIAKELREREDAVKEQLIQAMSTAQMPSVKFDKLGRFVLKQSSRYEIQDIEKMCKAMMAMMVDNAKRGRPWSDGLLLQKRPAKTIIEELIESSVINEDNLGGMGLARMDRMDLTFTRQKA